MIDETTFESPEEFDKAHLDIIVNVANEIYQLNGNKPVRILDLATGSNNFNPIVLERLISEGIEYEIILSDISPTHLKRGYRNIENALSPEELQKVKCVLADLRDLRKNIEEVPLWRIGKKPLIKSLDEVLKDPEYSFLSTGYKNNERIVPFEDESFDILIGMIPYTSINTGPYKDAIKESVRVLREGGYHIIFEMHAEEINPKIERTPEALERAKIKDIDNIICRLDSVLKPIAVHSIVHPYPTEERIPEQTLQYGDIIKSSILVHKK